GNLLIGDTGNNRIRQVDAKTGIITTLIGTDTTVDGVSAVDASVKLPLGITVDNAGNKFILENSNNRIRRVDGITGIITTVAGNGVSGFGGDGGPAVLANLNLSSSTGLAIDGAGNFIFADSGNNRVRRVDAVTKIITTVAGNGVFDFTGDGGPANVA